MFGLTPIILYFIIIALVLFKPRPGPGFHPVMLGLPSLKILKFALDRFDAKPFIHSFIIMLDQNWAS